MHISSSPSKSAAASCTLADLILSNTDAQAFFAWAGRVELHGVVIDGQPWQPPAAEPIPVPEVSESNFGEFNAAAGA